MNIEDLLELIESDEMQNLPEEKQEEYINELLHDMLAEVEEKKERYMKHRRKMSLEEILFYTCTADELKEICREEGFRGFSKFKVRELAGFVAGKLLEEEYLRKFLLGLPNDCLELVDEMIGNDNYTYLGMDDEYYVPLLAGGYAILDYEGNAELATDFNEIYKKIRDEEFEKERQVIDWAEAVMLWVQNMYGSAPQEMYYDLFRLKYDFTDERIDEVLDEIPEYQKLCVFLDGKIIAEGALENNIYIELEKRQEDIPFYIPASKAEIEDLYENSYLSRELKCINLKNWLIEYLNFDEFLANELTMEIWNDLNITGMPGRVEGILADYDIAFDSDAEMENFMDVFVEVFTNTRMLSLRGNKLCHIYPEVYDMINDMEEMTADQGEIEEDNVISMEEWKKNIN